MFKSIAVLSLIGFPLTGVAQEQCRDILANGFFDQFTKSSSESKYEAMYAELCGSNFQQAQRAIERAQQSGGGGSLNLSVFGKFGLGGSQSSNSGNSISEKDFNLWKSQYCNKQNTTDASKAADYLMQRIVSEPVVNAWSSCMQQREGLTCWAQPFEKDILVNINWKKASLSQPKITSSYVSQGAASQLDGTSIGKLFPADYLLNPGVLQIPITRSKSSSVLVTFNATHDGISHSCRAFVPGIPDYMLTAPTEAKSPQLGCSANAAPFGQACSGEWRYSASPGQRVCKVRFTYTAGPTAGARVTLDGNNSGGTIRWRVDRNEVPFGAGRWVEGSAWVSFVPADKSTMEDGTICNAATLASAQ